ncbi:putative ubiquitin-like-specific protease 1B [Triticum dicoccoides]|uniref:putative ubiquitin-like-specific protease 1B n=1 Tax=Triticum dicoccoides TaxID=85692 RepID=UPI00188F261C|nr:putative ubiquitin-like-specific protease 1B [Triticum dicoccoides]
MGGFYIGYKKFLVCFKPRGDMNDEVMYLCIEMNNMKSRAASGTNRKKYMFSVHAGMLLKQDPTTFQPAKLIPELERAVTKFKANKYDLLFFTIVHDKHWIIVCANLLYKQWNVFDSIHSKGKQSPLKKQANNLITNFAALAQEYSQFNVDVGSFARVDLEDYPKQDNLCDCGFFGLKYVENFDGKSMKEFNQEDVARYRMDVVHNLCTHPMNNAPMERAFKEELAA